MILRTVTVSLVNRGVKRDVLKVEVRMCLVGNMKARTFDREDGTQGVGVSLSVQDWFSLDRRSETA